MNKLESFLGIPFGSNKDLVIQRLAERNGILDETIGNNDTLFFSGISFAGRNTESILTTFYDNQLCKASVYIKPNLESKTIEIYTQIKNELNEKYYTSKSDFEVYDSPYEKNDGYTESAISQGKAEFSCFWSFGDGSETDDYISVKIDENLEIVIAYEEGELLDKLVTRNQKKNNLDY